MTTNLPDLSRRNALNLLALAYRASLQIINEISPEGQRAEVLASFQSCTLSPIRCR